MSTTSAAWRAVRKDTVDRGDGGQSQTMQSALRTMGQLMHAPVRRSSLLYAYVVF